MLTVVYLSSAVFAFLAAIFWALVAAVPLPLAIRFIDEGYIDPNMKKPEDDMDRLTKGLLAQSKWNKWGAACAAIAAALQGVAIL